MSKILLAEDEKALRDITVKYLTKNGIEVDETDNGNDACSLVERNHYDCIVLDIMMPGKDGKEVCKFIRSKYDVPVIFLTALGEECDIVEGYEIGADEYITKPFSTKLLQMKINALINRYRGLLVKNGMIVMDELVIEPAKRRVTANGAEITLAPKEYDLLIYLIENKGIVLSRNQILDQVWGREYEGYDRAVDTHIKKLRAALGDCGYHVETVIKAGYKWS
ncbi:DNA-binding response regulator, OmpR family, contains REC and winged-helix (wHTH) domain [Ruminococcaceae bacterium YAD3003]|nr:DNA-binding response regulator, OmpR family, contains REC and winged-helix (wHTH) domain [Ruminococcaceae bacterium YAD3003]